MEDPIRNATTELAAALTRGDAPAAAALYADNGKLLTPAADLVDGRAQIEAYWRAGLGLGLVDVVLAPTELDVGDDTAIELGRYELALDGVADRGRYVVLHRRQADDTWRRAVDVFNSNRKGDR
jgi:ketosteroid isomerase-like protein